MNGEPRQIPPVSPLAEPAEEIILKEAGSQSSGNQVPGAGLSATDDSIRSVDSELQSISGATEPQTTSDGQKVEAADAAPDRRQSPENTRDLRQTIMNLVAASDHPVRRWGIEYPLKALCLGFSIALIYMRIFRYSNSDADNLFTSVFGILVLLLYCQVPLYIFWCRSLHDLQEAIVCLRPALSKKTISNTLATNVLLGPHSIGILLWLAALVVAFVFQYYASGLPKGSFGFIGSVAFASFLVLGCMGGPIMVGGVLYLSIFSWITEQLKKYRHELPMNALTSTALVISGILLPSFCLAFRLDTTFMVIYVPLQIAGLALAISVTDRYRAFVRKLVEELPEGQQVLSRQIQPVQSVQPVSLKKQIVDRSSVLLLSGASIAASLSKIKLMVLVVGSTLITFLTGHLSNFIGHYVSDNDAIKCYQLTLSLNPYITDAYVSEAECYVNKGDSKSALKVLDHAISVVGLKDSYLYEERAKISGYKANNALAAIKDLDFLIDSALKAEYKPTWDIARFYKLRSRMQTMANDKARAEEDMKNYKKYRDQVTGDKLAEAAELEKKKQYQAALAALECMRWTLDDEMLLKRAELNANRLNNSAAAVGDYDYLISDIPPALAKTAYYSALIEKYESLKAAAEKRDQQGKGEKVQIQETEKNKSNASP